MSSAAIEADRELGYEPATAESRLLLAEACRIIAHAGLAEDILGHVSLRTNGGIQIRSRGPRERGLLFTSLEDIQEVRDNVPMPDGYKAPNELPIHSEIMKLRPEVKSVVHAHAPHVIAADLAGLELRPIVGAYNMPAMRMAAVGIKTYPRSVLINTEELGKEVAEAIGQDPVLILRGHGIVTVGETVKEAVIRALNLEALAKIHVMASSRGKVAYQVTESDMALMPDLGSAFNDGFVWQYHQARLELAGLSLR
ncbi:class II aldolase/adducin family protein [Arthrobacter crystallopoietes]|uniref:class II aldolase/adducin family protein n=1 Tax=Crystallibacter crystallopoietes TaxID=37928 RepID=UPI0011111A69|nr:class II aldolase/adducin family protein [Arthrobacter crystallopoietes]